MEPSQRVRNALVRCLNDGSRIFPLVHFPWTAPSPELGSGTVRIVPFVSVIGQWRTYWKSIVIGW